MTVETQLDTLEAKGLIRLAAYQPELEYLFRHWLVQDAAYESLLKQERRDLHRLVGEAIETLYPERRTELAGILAMHFDAAGDADKAVAYHVAAGGYALERNAITEAYGGFNRAAELLPPAADQESEDLRRRRIEVGLGRARAGYAFRPLDELIDSLEQLVPVAEALGDPPMIAHVHMNVALKRLQAGQLASDANIQRSLDRLAEIGDALDDPSLAALPLALVGMNQVFKGPIRDGVQHLEEAIPQLEKREDFIGSAYARGVLAIGHAMLGNFEQAQAAASYGSRLAAKGDVIAQLDALIAESWVSSVRGRLDEAVPLAQTCVLKAEETGATSCIVASSWILGDAYQRQGRLGEAQETLRRGRDIALVAVREMLWPTLQAWLSSVSAALGDETSPAEWEEALATARSIGNRVGEEGILSKRAEVGARRAAAAAAEGKAAGDAWHGALADFGASAAIAEELEARPDLARILRSWGEALRAAGRAAEGNESSRLEAEGDDKLRRALALFEELGIDAEAEAVRQELSASRVRGRQS
jgi:hypothetical protein